MKGGAAESDADRLQVTAVPINLLKVDQVTRNSWKSLIMNVT